MRELIILLGTLGTACAADIYVCDSPQQGHACTYTTAQLQTAITAAACGDTLYLQPNHTYHGVFTLPGGDCSANPITVTSATPDWLPVANARITPGYKPVLPVLSSNTVNTSAVSTLLKGTTPASGWHFIGVGFTVDSGLNVTGSCTAGAFNNALIAFGGTNVHYIATGPTELPDNILLDRNYFFLPHNNTQCAQHAIRAEARRMTIKNNWIEEIFYPGFETHAIQANSTEGPITVSNNFMSISSIPYIWGGDYVDYSTTLAKDTSMKYNFVWRPWKWYPTQAKNPYYSDYLANGSKSACYKNGGEFKMIAGATVTDNVIRNVWDVECQGQIYGQAATPRVKEQSSQSSQLCYSYSGATYMGTLTVAANGTDFSWSGSPWFDNSSPCKSFSVGDVVCARPSSDGMNRCRRVTSIDLAARTGSIAGNSLGAWDVTGAMASWSIAMNSYSQFSHVYLARNVYENTSGCLNILGRTLSTPNIAAGEYYGIAYDVTYEDNLCLNTYTSGTMRFFLKLLPNEVPFFDGQTAQNISVQHNTYYGVHGSTLPASAINFAGPSVGSQKLKVDGLKFNSNLIPNAASNNSSINGDGTFGSSSLSMSTYVKNSEVRNNYLTVNPGCSGNGNVCSGNFSGTYTPGFQDPGRNNYKLLPSSTYLKGGLDRADIGANADKLPLIRNIKTLASDHTALLEFDLGATIADAGNTQPCTLEVSSNENLRSMLGDFTVTNDLNPNYFKQPDVTSRTNPLLLSAAIQGRHVQFPIGRAMTVTGDDGVAHDLNLTPSTQYWGRIGCYGDMEWFTFTTTAAASRASSLPMQFHPPAGVTAVQVDYGPTASLGSTKSASVDAGGNASLSVPVTAGQALYTKVAYKNGGDIVYAGPLKIQLP